MTSNDDRYHDNSHLRKHLTFVLIFFTFSSVLTLYFSAKLPSSSKYPLPISQSARNGYFVDNPGCQMPELDPFSPEVKPLYKKTTGLYNCSGHQTFLEIVPDAALRIKAAILYLNHGLRPAKANCTLEPIFRLEEKDSFYMGPKQNLSLNVPLNIDAARVTCYKGQTVYHEEYLPLVPIKEDLENQREKPDDFYKSQPLNVIIVGVDSMSKLNFQRHLPKTRNFMKKIHAIQLKGYNKVGENTFPNLLALLTGIRVTDAFKAQYKKQTNDRVPLIWKDFANYLGHRTLMVEDNPTLSLFNFHRKGFKKQPSDYYFRPFAMAVEDSHWYKNSSSKFCFGSKNEMIVAHDHLIDFVKTMGGRPFFAFVFTSRLTHNVMNNAGYTDLPLFNLFKTLYAMGQFDKSLVILMSDHGTRFGPIRKTFVGRFEEHWPIMFLSFPQWFLRIYPDIYSNLRLNQNRLTTAFDIYATLKNLLDIQRGETTPKMELNQRGISLFQEIPEDRTCNDAGISEHFCTCNFLKSVNVNTSEVQAAALRLVDTVNQWLELEKANCVFLKLKNVIHAHVTHSSAAATGISGVTGHMDYLVAITVNPSDAELEGTLRWTREKGTFQVLGDVSRINEYGDQSDCIDDVWLRKFCFCKTRLIPSG